jgi:hypothetical protein
MLGISITKTLKKISISLPYILALNWWGSWSENGEWPRHPVCGKNYCGPFCCLNFPDSWLYAFKKYNMHKRVHKSHVYRDEVSQTFTLYCNQLQTRRHYQLSETPSCLSFTPPPSSQDSHRLTLCLG